MHKNFEQKTFTHWLKRNRMRFHHHPYPIQQRKHKTVFRFSGVTPRIRFVIRKNGMLEIWVRHKQVIDILTNFDLAERRTSEGKYYCDLCVKEEMFATRQALWENHFEFMLQWANESLRETQWLCLFAAQGGTNWAEFKNEEDARKSVSSEFFVDACPVIMALNSKSQQEKSL